VSASPDVLVVLPTLGTRNDRLRRAFESITQQRDTVPLTIALVVPSDQVEARDIGRQHGALIVDDPGRGMSAAMNAGRQVVTTERFTIWLGDDDAYIPGGLALLRQLLIDTPGAVVAYGACKYVDDSDATVWTSQAGILASRIIGFGPNLIPHPAAMIRIDALEAIGGYDEKLHLVMDLAVFLTLKKRGRFVATTTPVASFGWHPQSLTVSGRRESEREARAVKRQALPALLRPLSWLWEGPVALASRIAATTLNRRVTGTLSR
jgi:hypothetical protein